MNVLVISAHPDDEVLGCGGTIARLATEGNVVYLAILGEGITSRSYKSEQSQRADVEALRVSSHRVATLLGAKDLFMFGLPDNRFDTVPLLEIVKTIEGLIERLKPELVLTHHASDLNIDHQLVNRAVLTATRPTEGCSVKELLAFEVLSSSEWAFDQFHLSFMPNVFVDITSGLEKKIAAMQLYQGESRAFPHPRSPEGIRALAQWRGISAGLRAAEAFQLIRKILK